jgi:hypothetical protein
MRATIHLSNQQTVTVEGVDSIGHAENVANIIASRFSASYGKAIFPTCVQIDSNNFTTMMGDEAIMEGVTVISSVGGK